MTNTDYPVKRYTAIHYTQPAAAISPLSKSTRHLTVQEPDVLYFFTNTVDRKNLKQGTILFLILITVVECLSLICLVFINFFVLSTKQPIF